MEMLKSDPELVHNHSESFKELQIEVEQTLRQDQII